MESIQGVENETDATTDDTRGFLKPKKVNKKRKLEEDEIRADEAYSYLKRSAKYIENRDEFSTFGEHVANQVRNLQDRQLQIIAQHKINNILFELAITPSTADSISLITSISPMCSSNSSAVQSPMSSPTYYFTSEPSSAPTAPTLPSTVIASSVADNIPGVLNTE